MTATTVFPTWECVEQPRSAFVRSFAAAGFLAFTGGTGGDVVAAEVAKRLGTGSAVEAAPQAEPREMTSGLAVEVQTIRDALRLSVSELAQLFAVSRPTIYSWQAGNAVSDTNAARVRAIAHALEPHLPLFESQVGRVAHRAIDGRATLLRKLAEGADAQQAIERLAEILHHEKVQRERLAQRLEGKEGTRGRADLDTLG